MIASPHVPPSSAEDPFQGRWAVVLRGGEEGSVALHELLRAFWYPGYAFFRRHEFSSEAAAMTLEHLLAEMLAQVTLINPCALPPLFREFLLEHAQRAAAEPPV